MAALVEHYFVYVTPSNLISPTLWTSGVLAQSSKCRPVQGEVTRAEHRFTLRKPENIIGFGVATLLFTALAFTHAQI